MAKRIAPKLGWNNGGWVGSFQFTKDQLEQLSMYAPGLAVEPLESFIADYRLYRANEIDMPTPKQRDASLDLLSQAVLKVDALLGRQGIDQISRDHISCHLAVAGQLRLIPELRKQLALLDDAILIERAAIKSGPKGRPKKITDRELAERIYSLFKATGLKIVTTKTGAYVSALDICFEAAGSRKEDIQSLARSVIDVMEKRNAK